MNYLNEEDYIKAINDNPENRAYQLLFAEYLQEKGEDNLAEGWRVLIENEKKPEMWTLENKWWMVDDNPEWIGWNWEPSSEGHSDSPTKLYDVLNRRIEIPHPLLDKAFSTFFGAIQAAAVAYVRYTYDENYGKECPVCDGTGIYRIHHGEHLDPREKECSNCAGKGVTG